ncbi:PilN domain-containing protein [Variovorax paradoxus]|nr:PilN domain-containing protein [Variovorax paradoxus]
MKPKPALGLDFAPKPRWRRATLALLVLGVIGSGLALWQRQDLLERRAAALSQLETQQRITARTQPSRAPAVRPEATDEADRLVAGLQRPWEPMLNALQAAIKDDVVVNRVQPETDAFRLRIVGQADSSQAFVEFVQRLRGNAAWRAVEPLSEARQPDNAAPDGKPVVFQLAVEWRRP